MPFHLFVIIMIAPNTIILHNIVFPYSIKIANEEEFLFSDWFAGVLSSC